MFLFIFAVLPVSALGPAHFSAATYVTGPIGHTFLVGPSMVLPARRFAVARMDINGNPYGFDALDLDAPEWPAVVAWSQDPSLRSS